MSLSRLTTAIAYGALALPEGKITVMRSAADYDVSALPRADLMIANGFYPDFAAWNNAGYVVTAKAEPAEVAIVVVPRSKALARAMIAAAASWAKLVIVDGQKTDGVESLFKDCRKRLGQLPSVPKGHGRIFWFAPAPVFDD